MVTYKESQDDIIVNVQVVREDWINVGFLHSLMGVVSRESKYWLDTVANWGESTGNEGWVLAIKPEGQERQIKELSYQDLADALALAQRGGGGADDWVASVAQDLIETGDPGELYGQVADAVAQIAFFGRIVFTPKGGWPAEHD